MWIYVFIIQTQVFKISKTSTYGICEGIIVEWKCHSAFIKAIGENDVIRVVFVFSKSTFWAVLHFGGSPIVTGLENTFVHSDDHFVRSTECWNRVWAWVTGLSIVAHWPAWWTLANVGTFPIHCAIMSTTTVVDVTATIESDWFWNVEVVTIFWATVAIFVAITATGTSFYK